MHTEEADRHPVRSLLVSLGFGILLFDGALFVLLALLSYNPYSKPDPSVSNFYWLVTFCGLVFGFERWWHHESGGINPFHDR